MENVLSISEEHVMVLRTERNVIQESVPDAPGLHGDDLDIPRWWEITCHDCGEVFESQYDFDTDDTCRQCDSSNVSSEEI